MKMLYCAEHELASMLAAWPAAEDRITHLYELDPTHVAARPAGQERIVVRHRAFESRSPQPFCLLADAMPVPVLLELDPTHAREH
jgi:hypothetical protein